MGGVSLYLPAIKVPIDCWGQSYKKLDFKLHMVKTKTDVSIERHTAAHKLPILDFAGCSRDHHAGQFTVNAQEIDASSTLDFMIWYKHYSFICLKNLF